MLPMTGFIEIARRALETAGHRFEVLQDFAVVESLPLSHGNVRTVQILLEEDSFQVFSLDDDAWVLHASGGFAKKTDWEVSNVRLEERE